MASLNGAFSYMPSILKLSALNTMLFLMD
jgi:hypothetical protein